MPTPGIFITFQTMASNAIKRSEKGTILLLLRDSSAQGTYAITRPSEIPKGITEENKHYIERAFIGYQTAPKKVLIHIDTAESGDLSKGLAWAKTQLFDYMCGPPDTSPEEAAAIITWVKAERKIYHAVKAVLPNQEADYEGIINFTGDGMKIGEKTYTTAEYCSRIAGIIAGTPMSMSCTYAPLPELEDITRLDDSAADTAVDAGKLILINDGIKVKIARGVNSLKTISETKGKPFQKIKILELLDMIQTDLRVSIADSYIGKYSNSYDNKLVLITAIQNYLNALERDGLIKSGSSSVEIDIDAQSAWLNKNGQSTEDMNDQEIKEANTGSSVFIKMTFSPLDAIEDVVIPITVR